MANLGETYSVLHSGLDPDILDSRELAYWGEEYGEMPFLVPEEELERERKAKEHRARQKARRASK